MTELEKAAFYFTFVILILTIVWAVMMIHQDLSSIWRVESEIKEELKKSQKPIDSK